MHSRQALTQNPASGGLQTSRLRRTVFLAPLLLAACSMQVSNQDAEHRCGADFAPSCDAEGNRLSCVDGALQAEACAQGLCVDGGCCAAAAHASASGIAEGVCTYDCEAGYTNHGSATQPRCEPCPEGFVNTGSEDAPACELTAVCADLHNIRRPSSGGVSTTCPAGEYCIQADSQTPARCVKREELVFEMSWRYLDSSEIVTFTVADPSSDPSDFDLDCGGGVFEEGKSTGEHVCPAPEVLGEVTIRMRGYVQHVDLNCGSAKTTARLTAVKAWGLNPWASMTSLFGSCRWLEELDPAGPNLSRAPSLANLFTGTNFNGDISAWDTSKVTKMSGMFKDNSEFQGSLAGWDVSNVDDMSSMFSGTQFNGDISGWDVSKVTNMSHMFDGSSFDRDISGWDVSNVTNYEGVFDNSAISEAHKPRFR